MKKFITLVALLATTLCATNAQKPTSLFNGKNIEGWSTYTEDMDNTVNKVFTIDEKLLTLSGEEGYIYSNDQYNNYELTLEWRWVNVGSTSGLLLNMGGKNKLWPECYEVRIENGATGAITHHGGVSSDEYFKSGRSLPARKSKVEKEVGKWNKMEVVCKNNTISVSLNGTKQNEIRNISHKSGYIGLKSDGKIIQFRNIKVTRL